MQEHEVVDLRSFHGRDAGKTDNQVPDQPHLPAGTKLLLGQHTIEGYLNCGGFGITYIARDSLHRRVVIKECFPGEMCYRDGRAMAPRHPKYRDEIASIVRQFIQEAHTLANIRHPNIVHVHQIFEQNDTAYIVMDFIDGPDLLDLVGAGSGSLAPKQVQQITRTMLSALAHIHAQGMLHRDISPDNILIGRDGEPVLIDFGASRSHRKQGCRSNARMKFVKDGYSPQEFYVGGSEQGAFSDLYALAATIHYVITGHAPADSQSRLDALAAMEPDPYIPLTGRVAGYPRRFLKALDTALAMLPEDRIQTADDWLSRIRPRSVDLAGPFSRTPTAVLDSLLAVEAPATRPAPANRLVAARVAAVALLALGGVAAAPLVGGGGSESVLSGMADAGGQAAPQAEHMASAAPSADIRRPFGTEAPAALPVIDLVQMTLPAIAGRDDLPAPPARAAGDGAPVAQTDLAGLRPPAGPDENSASLPRFAGTARAHAAPGLAEPGRKSPLPARVAPPPPVVQSPMRLEMPVFTSATLDTPEPTPISRSAAATRARHVVGLQPDRLFAPGLPSSLHHADKTVR